MTNVYVIGRFICVVFLPCPYIYFFISSLFLHEVCVFEKSNNLVNEPYLQPIKYHKNQTVDRFDMSSKEKYKSEEI